MAEQDPNADLGSDTDNEPEKSASLLGADQGSELDNEDLISLQEFYNSEEVSDEVLDPKLCQIVNTMLSSKISKDKLKDKLENYIVLKTVTCCQRQMLTLKFGDICLRVHFELTNFRP